MSGGVILGTAGHIDHGKTALVKALTGVDTDRLAEEKERGITIDLGFAELAPTGAPRLGIVDVPGHRDFVRNMVAGATGMDLVLLVVAADEGVMPQTREHLAIVELLAVRELVVAITKRDLVEDEWLDLVDAEIAELLKATPYAKAPRIPTSVRTGEGLDALTRALTAAAGAAARGGAHDLSRLPVDRVFTVQGTGTVVTGTLWSGTIAREERVRLFPGGEEARVRGVHVHGRDVDRAEAGDRTAIALAGTDRRAVARGSTLVTGAGWAASWMLTVRVRVLPGSEWSLEDRQRVRVHLGTAEVMARCALLGSASVAPGERAWAQLRLEEPLLARARDRLILRSYSPVTTLGGGQVAEPLPAKRRGLDAGTEARLTAILDGEAAEAVRAVVELAGWNGASVAALPVLAGRGVDAIEESLTADAPPLAGGSIFDPAIAAEAERLLLGALEAEQTREPLRPSVPLELLRMALPPWAHPALPGLALARLQERGAVELAAGGARSPEHRPRLDAGQAAACERILEVFREAGLAPPGVEELPAELSGRRDLWPLLKHLEASGALRPVADGLYMDAGVLDRMERHVSERLGGRRDLTPADFREVLPVSRKHLIPLLNHLDGVGVTVRSGDRRHVPGTG